MKILQVHNYYRFKGGEDQVVRAERALLGERGHEVIPYEASSAEINRPALLLHVLLWSHHAPWSAKRFARALREHRPDLVHAHNLFPLITPSIYGVCRQAGVPVVQTLHNFRILYPNALLYHGGRVDLRTLKGSAWRLVPEGVYQGSRLLTAKMAHSIEWHRRRNTWNRMVDRFIVLSPFARDLFVRFGIEASRISVKPNFMTQGLQSEPNQESDLSPPQGAGVGDSGDGSRFVKPFALYAGRLSPEKGLRPIVGRWNLDLPSLVVAGEGPDSALLRRTAEPGVEFTGWQDRPQVQALIERASVLLLPSECYEGFPMSLLEAMSHRVPIVAYDLGAQADIIRKADCGVLVQPGDPDAFVRAVRQLLADPAERARLGENGRRACQTDYSPETNYRQLLAIYRQALGSS